MTITVVIPTKDRHQFLMNLLRNLSEQSFLPTEVIVVDQTSDVIDLSSLDVSYKLNYLHRVDVKSLVEAKSVGVIHSTSDFICFLDDDSRPHGDFIKELLSGMKEMGAVGMCGFVSNYEYKSKIMHWVYPIFHHGYFRGERMGVFGDGISSSLPDYIRTHQITGGCSIWSKDVFDHVSFDLENRFHLFEDIDFSYQVNLLFKDRLYINTRAKIEDLYHEVGPRDFGRILFMRMHEVKKVYKKYKGSGHIARVDFVMYVIGRALEAMMISMREKSLSPLRGFVFGLVN